MTEDYYPWGGEFTAGAPHGPIAVVLLNIKYCPPDSVAIYGSLKTENIGVEKIVANTISNPFIRYLVVCGEDIRGHRSGSSLIALHQNGIDTNHRIIDAPGAIPYIENLDKAAIRRFQQQLTIVNLIGVTEKQKIDAAIADCVEQSPPCFGEPYIAIRIKPESVLSMSDKRALHSKIIIQYLGTIKKRGE
jgi:tetrahydromethanopterin S-methyltransferase subunit A